MSSPQRTAQSRASRLPLWLAILAGLKSLAASTALTGVIGYKWAAFALAVSAALDIGTSAYVATARRTQRR